MISILVTYYNQENYVTRSLDSIFTQNLNNNFEVLIGDDGSTDNTVKIINEYKSKYPNKIKLYIMPRDINKRYNSVERASLNRLNLLKNAHGKYICFLDGDDEYIHKSFLQDSINFLEKEKKFIGISYNFIITKKNNDKEYTKLNINNNVITLKDYAKGLYIHVGCMVFRRPRNKELKKVIRLKSFDDNDITYFFLNKGNLFYKNIPVYNYYSNENSICNSTCSFEFEVLNAIDYEIIQKIISKSHLYVFKRYYGNICNVYAHRTELKKFNKFQSICVKNGLFDKLYNWDKLTNFERNFIRFKMKKYRIIYRIIKKLKFYNN